MAFSKTQTPKKTNRPKTSAPLPKLAGGWSEAHLHDFDMLQAGLARWGLAACLKALKTDAPAVQLLKRTLEMSSKTLEADPRQLAGHLIGRLADYADPDLSALLEQARRWRGAPWLCPAGATLETPSGPLLHILKGHGDFIGSLVILPGGEYLVSASEDGTLRVWDMADGVELRTLTAHSNCVNIITLTPDGAHLLSGSDDATIKVWDIRSWRVLRTLEGHTGYVRDVRALPDGRVVSCSQDGTVRVWNLEQGRLLHTFEGHNAWVNGLAVTPDGRMAISSAINNDIKAWDMEALVELPPFFEAEGRELTTMLIGDVFFSVPNKGAVGHTYYAVRLAITPDGQHLISIGDEVIIWDIATRAQLERFSPHSSHIEAMALLDDGRTLATGAECIKLWDISAEAPGGTEPRQALVTLTGHTDTIKSIAGNRRVLVSGSNDKTIRVWDRTWAASSQDYAGHARSVISIILSPDERLALSGGNDGCGRLWELDSGRCRHIFGGHKSPFVNAAAFTPDGQKAVTTTHQGQVKVWDVVSGALILDMAHPTDENYWIDAFALTPDGKFGLAGAVGRSMTRWNMRRGSKPRVFAKSEFQIGDIAITSDGQRAVTAAYGKRDDLASLQGWDISTCKLLWEVWPEPTQEKVYFSHVILTPDDRQAIAGTSQGWLYVVNVESGAVLARWEAHPGAYINQLFLRRDGYLATAATEDSRLTCRLWDVKTQQNTRTLASERFKPRTPRFSADGRYAVFASGVTVILWDLERDLELAAFDGDSNILQTAISANGQTIVAGEDAGRVHVLQVT